MSQEQRILDYISDRKWHHVLAIIEYVVPGGANVAIRSRISALQPKLAETGQTILSRTAADGQAEYRLAFIGELPL